MARILNYRVRSTLDLKEEIPCLKKNVFKDFFSRRRNSLFYIYNNIAFFEE